MKRAPARAGRRRLLSPTARSTSHPSSTLTAPPARLAPPACSHQALVKAATQLDRGAIALDTRPQLRAGLALYFLLLHLVALLL